MTAGFTRPRTNGPRVSRYTIHRSFRGNGGAGPSSGNGWQAGQPLRFRVAHQRHDLPAGPETTAGEKGWLGKGSSPTRSGHGCRLFGDVAAVWAVPLTIARRYDAARTCLSQICWRAGVGQRRPVSSGLAGRPGVVNQRRATSYNVPQPTPQRHGRPRLPPLQGVVPRQAPRSEALGGRPPRRASLPVRPVR